VEPLYLDHAATSPPLPEALAAFDRAARTQWANPGSLHRAGAEAALALERARADLARALGADGWRVVFTATGTESNLLGIQGGARAARKRAERGAEGARARVLWGAVEHPSSRAAAEALADEGFTVECVPVDRLGVVRVEALAARLGPDVAAVSVHWANNELGTLNPIAELVAATRRLAPHAFFHCDAVQAAGKRAEPLAALGADAIAVAAHKLGGVRGCAALLLRPGAREPRPQMLGGGHEGGLRSGTENVMGAVAFACAACARAELFAREPRALLDRRARLLALLRERAPDLVEVAPASEREQLGSILSVAFPGARARTLLTALEERGVLVGSGSACHGSGEQKISPVLQAIGCAPELAGAVLRFSMSGTESEADLLRAAEALASARDALARAPARRV
jgi:cysteine desulfurase